MNEIAFGFECSGETLVGILHLPDSLVDTTAHKQAASRGVVFVVGGGPQYRCGGHRQLTQWARQLCHEGYPVLRFDYRGMGDSQGEFHGFECINDDIHAAINVFIERVPSLKDVVLWGECDAASAILFYACRDTRVKGIVLLNPWARTSVGEAEILIRFYYIQRLMQASFWKKIIDLRFNALIAIASFIRLLNRSRMTSLNGGSLNPANLHHRLLTGLIDFKGPVLVVLSGRDLIAREFEAMATKAGVWKAKFRPELITRHDLPDCDHTFSSALQRNQVVSYGLAWLRRW